MKAKYVALIGAMLMSLPTAFAGMKMGALDVYIDAGARYARGTMLGTNLSADGDQYMNCTQNMGSWGGYISCTYRSASNQYASCYTYDANIIATIRSIQETSSLYLWWDEYGKCTSAWVDTNSYYLR